MDFSGNDSETKAPIGSESEPVSSETLESSKESATGKGEGSSAPNGVGAQGSASTFQEESFQFYEHACRRAVEVFDQQGVKCRAYIDPQTDQWKLEPVPDQTT